MLEVPICIEIPTFTKRPSQYESLYTGAVVTYSMGSEGFLHKIIKHTFSILSTSAVEFFTWWRSSNGQ